MARPFETGLLQDGVAADSNMHIGSGITLTDPWTGLSLILGGRQSSLTMAANHGHS